MARTRNRRKKSRNGEVITVRRPQNLGRTETEENERRSTSSAAVVARQEMSFFSGPVPHPDLFRGYEEVLPGSSDRILSLAERQSEHRQALESQKLGADIMLEKRGQLIAACLTTLTICLGAFLINSGKDTIGLVTLISPLAILAGLFVYTKQSAQRELQQKREALEQTKPTLNRNS